MSARFSGLLVVLAASCAAPTPGSFGTIEIVEHVEATAPPTVSTRDVLERLEDYRSWPRVRSEAVKSDAHRTLWLVVHHNDVAAPAIEGALPTFPEGSIIVGENRIEPDGPPVALTTMVKRSSGWHWIEHEPTGAVLMAGALDTCVRCHSRAERDMVFLDADQQARLSNASATQHPTE